MKKIKNVIIIIVILMSVGNVSLAHGGNITGWKDKDSENITEYNGKYYGYHKEDGVVHYHQVKWDEENQKIINLEFGVKKRAIHKIMKAKIK